LSRSGDPVEATAISTPGEVIEGRIVAVDNRVDEAAAPCACRPPSAMPKTGCGPEWRSQINLVFTGADYPAVDPLAIQWGAEGAFVWVVRAGKAERVPIRILQRNGRGGADRGRVRTRRPGRDRRCPGTAPGRRGHRHLSKELAMDRQPESPAGQMSGGHGTALFIRRPILAFVLNALIVIAGLAGSWARCARIAGCRPAGRFGLAVLSRVRRRKPSTAR
jgi:hypothetical protein